MNRILLVPFFVATIACVCLDPALGASPDGIAERPTPQINEDAKRGIDESSFVSIGGIDQWVTIKGDDRSLPAILFLHGGPGNPLTPHAENLYGAWEKSFVSVQWDQRGAGKTYGKNQPATELTLEMLEKMELTIDQIVNDAIELAEYLARHLRKEKLILTGSSWGSVLGIHLAKKRPDLFHAYVGVSQMVNYDENMSASYAQVLALAKTENDEETLATLESISPPPWVNPRSFGQLRRIIRKYEAKACTEAPLWQFSPEYDTPEYRASYAGGEEFSFIKFVGLKGDGMASKIDLPALGLDFRIPIFFIQGEEDLLTVPTLTKRYFSSIVAPSKELILIPKSGHDPNFSVLTAHFETIHDRVLPLID